jgi:predicted NBD/HSP70 family sugar kinase
VLPNGSPALMRAINAARVVRELRSDGPMSRASLVRATGLSKPTITNVVTFLETEGHIEPAGGGGEPGGNSRAQLYRYRADRGQVLGIDIGADKILLMLADLDGATLGTTRLPLREVNPSHPGEIFDRIAQATSELLARAGSSAGRLLAVVAGTPGVVSAEGIVTMAPQLPGWNGLDLGGALAAIFDCPVHIEREVALSMQAERWAGVASGIDNALFIHLGVGVAAGLLVDGEIYRGAQGGAGEIGMMPLPTGGAGSRAGFGPFESQAGGVALQFEGRAAAETPAGARLLELAAGDAEAVDAAVVFAAARERDPEALGVVDGVVRTLAWGISCLVCALNPGTIIIGGGLSRAADVFLPDLEKLVAEAVPLPPNWLVSGLRDESVALGAVHHATDLVERTLFLTPDIRRSP